MANERLQLSNGGVAIRLWLASQKSRRILTRSKYFNSVIVTLQHISHADNVRVEELPRNNG